MSNQENERNPEEELMRSRLKAQALQERLAQVEDENAELRVNLTILNHQMQQAQQPQALPEAPQNEDQTES